MSKLPEEFADLEQKLLIVRTSDQLHADRQSLRRDVHRNNQSGHA
jgi:hypothetical protein